MIRYRYIGPGWSPGIPARDLTDADLATLTKQQRAAVEYGPLYKRHDPGPGRDRRDTEYQDELDLPSSQEEEK